MIPNYMQSWGLARAFGRRADPYRLVAQREPVGRRWALHVESLERAVSSRTRGRIGWIVGPVKTVAELWSYQDYTTLTPGLLSDRLARRALDQDSASASSPGPAKLSAATFRGWRRGSSAKASCSTTFRPWPCAIAMVKYRAPIGAMRLFDRLRLEKSVLITPGAHFGLAGKYIRIGYGYDIDHTLAGLARVEQLFAELRGPAGSNLTARTGVRPPARAATLLP
jgi:aspartate/methionine/tyrosine aminotransferase